MKRRTLLTTALAASTALGLAACGAGEDPLAADPGTGQTATSALVIGSANFPENELLAEMYAQVLEESGVEVDRNFGIGSREIYLRALQDGSIHLIPEYNGALLAAVSEGGVPEDVSTPEEVYEALQDALPDGLTVLEQAEAQNKDSLTVTRATAEQYGLTSIADLAPVAGQLTAGGAPEFAERYQGLVGLEEVYGVEFAGYRSLDVGGPLTVQALLDGDVQVANLFTTDSSIETNDLVVLEDPEDLFLAENVVPLISAARSDSRIADALNAFSETLTTEKLTEYLARVQVGKEPVSEVVGDYLEANPVEPAES
ncbi:ABC transporter substrate-binding protein [Paenibacillus sp. TRM 82003]|uniref:ABC transporter substrate-binding protein n=1 Tax=Kineococcus sp. TRM81007 TaxID=2925831 RepID=UPI001F59BC99|nr:ABC transporter substrate-binding protein [Kineococcus sp. TRM81007]MCI2239329.1 ABC transporter substrate-binding protein [Kineococcus sp. TRM81007]MCI3925013.1 ABC transporter substrate-binding protein [Paenibacillus sp. TRM 82003]